MAFNLGINVIETNGTASPAIAGAPTSVAGLVLRSRRGPTTGNPIRVSDFRQFRARFGGFDPRFIGAYCVDGFFRNGGREAYIARVIASGSQAASLALNGRDGNPTLTVRAGYRGSADVGAWGNDLFIDIVDNPEGQARLTDDIAGNSPARLLGQPLPSRVNLSPLPGNITRSLGLQSGGETFTVSFGQLLVPEQSTLQDIVDVINTQVGDSILATTQSGGILLTSTAKGNGSTIAVVEETLNILGFSEETRDSSSSTAAQPAALQGGSISEAEEVNLADLTLILSGFGTNTEPLSILLTGPLTPQGFIEAVINQPELAGAITANLVIGDDPSQVSIRLASVAVGANTTVSLDIVDTNDQTNDTALEALGFPTAESRAAQGVDSAPATLTGGTLGAEIDLRGSNGVLAIQVDDLPSPLLIDLSSLSTAAAPVSAQDVVDVINSQANDIVTATITGSAIQLTSESSFSLIGDDTLARLGFVNDQRVLITGEAGRDATEENPESLIIPVASVDEFQENQWVCLSDAITQDCYQITALDSVENTVTVSIPADASPLNEYRVADGAMLATLEFDLLVYQLNLADQTRLLVETWESLISEPGTPNNAVSQINDPASGSAYIMMENLNTAESFSGNQSPEAGEKFRLGSQEAGSDGDADPIPSDYQVAIDRFDVAPIQLLSLLVNIPSEPVLRAITRAGLDFCERKGDCMFVGHTPNVDAAGARAFGRRFRASKVYGALYWPWISITDPIGMGANPTRVVPPTGHISGVYARIDQTRGVWKAPAGNEARLRGALAVNYNITDVDHTDLVKNGSVNGVRNKQGVGICCDASRTCSTDTRWLYVNVRLLFNFVKASLRESLGWVKQEPNRETLWNKIKYNVVIPFLQGLYQDGAFGPGTPDQVFTVVCGPENNPPDQIQLGNLKVEVYFFPARPAETIVIEIGQQDGGTSANEA